MFKPRLRIEGQIVMQGHIQKINVEKYFGFIKGDDGQDYFFHRDDFSGHWSDLIEDHNKKDHLIPVRFEASDTPKGMRGLNVSRLDHPNEG